MVYFPDWGGNLYAVDKNSGKLAWSHKISEYDSVPTAISRVSPAISDNLVVIGDNQNPKAAHNGTSVIAVDRQTGALRWITKVDNHLAAVITGPPVIYNDTVFVGVSSNEESLAVTSSYLCCSFRGSVVALNLHSGAVIWKTYVVPDNFGRADGYSGGAVWDMPAIDPNRGLVYVGTGNNYTVPASVLACQQVNPSAVCTSPDDHFDSALALDIQSGAIRWSTRLQGFDVWTVACLSKPPGVNCPDPSSPDFDMGGAGPNIVGNIVGFPQKSGIYWALNPDTGAITWHTVVGPGGTIGGIEWGTASDGQRIYVAIGNGSHLSYTLANNGPTINWGSWAALDVGTGKVIWQVPDPTPGAIDTGAVSVANGVLYAGSYSGFMYGMNAATGAILFNFQSGGSVIDGPSITGSTLYWGSGYANIRPGTPNNKVFAFSLNGKD
jgi:polyvinyl alcohol dehydrogenase (cytochrome)